MLGLRHARTFDIHNGEAMTDIVLWENQVLSGPFTAGPILTSADIDNNLQLNALQLVLKYQALDPDGATLQVGYALQAVIEAEITAGMWAVVAAQNGPIKGTDKAKQQLISLAPSPVANPGVPEKIGGGPQFEAEISRHQGTAAEKMRVVVNYLVLSASKPQLNSLTLSGFVRQFKEEGGVVPV